MSLFLATVLVTHSYILELWHGSASCSICSHPTVTQNTNLFTNLYVKARQKLMLAFAKCLILVWRALCLQAHHKKLAKCAFT